MSSSHKKTTISNNIPLPSTYVTRTESECQLAMDLAVAERRDERMFHRLINGIQDRHRQLKKKADLPTSSRPAPRTRPTEHEVVNTGSNEYSNRAFTLAKIVSTHHSDTTNSTDCFLNTQHHQIGDDNVVPSPSILPTILKPPATCKNLSDSTLSDNDWSITGYDNTECYIDIEQENGDDDNDDNDEEIFILDL